MFQLTEIEREVLRSQFATSSGTWGGRRSLPYVFTEYGAVMLASVINSPIAINASVQLEKKYDHQFSAVFDAIRNLMKPPEVGHREIGIHTKLNK